MSGASFGAKAPAVSTTGVRVIGGTEDPFPLDLRGRSEAGCDDLKWKVKESNGSYQFSSKDGME